MPVLVFAEDLSGEANDSTIQPVTDVDTSRWLCRLCIYPLAWFGTIDFGPAYVSDSSRKFGDYRGLDKRGLFFALDGDAHFRGSDGGYFDLYAQNLAIDSRQLELMGGTQGRFETRLAYSEIPKYRGFGTQTPFQDPGGDSLTLPADWVRAPVTSGMSSLEQSLHDTALKTSRKTLDAGLTLKFAVNWSFRVDFERQKKDGTRPFGAGLFQSNTTHIPAPVDFTTNQFDMALDYAGERSNLSFGFSGSEFRNGTSTISWDNPFLSAPGTESFRADLAPDNKYYQFSLVGAFAPTPKLRLSGRASLGRMKQNDPLLPYSTNPLYADLPLPRSSLDGKIDTSVLNLAGKLRARLARKLDFTIQAKLDERDNKTPSDLWTPVLTDLVLTPERLNRPYSFKREKYELQLRWRLRNQIRLSGGVRQENIKRDLQSVKKTRQRNYWGELSASPWAVAQFRVKVESSERDASPYLLLDDGGPVENPLMRKFNLADRDRNGAIVELDLSPMERLGISLSYFTAEDKYSASVVGLRESEDQTLSLDLNYAINSDTSLYAFYNCEDISSEMSSISGNSGLPWDAHTDDTINTVGFGISGKMTEKISFGLDWVSSDAKSRILTETGQGEDPFPTLRNDLRNTRLHVNWQLRKQWALKVQAEHEKSRSDDWQIDGLDPDGLLSVLSLGLVSPNYSVTVLRLLASYRF